MSANEKLIISVDSETTAAENKLKTAVRRMSRQQVSLDTKTAGRNIDQLGGKLASVVSPSTSGALSGVQSVIGNIGGAALAAVAGVAALGAAAVKAGKAILDFGRASLQGYLQTQQLAAQAGLLTGEFEAIQFAAKASGLDISTLTRAIFDLNKRTSEAAKGNKTYGDALKALNLDIAELNNLTSKQRFDRVVAELSKVSNQADKAQIAYNLFGRAGRQLLPILSDNANGLAALTREGEKYIVTSEQQIQLARDAKAEEARLAAERDLALDSLGESAANAARDLDEFYERGKNGAALLLRALLELDADLFRPIEEARRKANAAQSLREEAEAYRDQATAIREAATEAERLQAIKEVDFQTNVLRGELEGATGEERKAIIDRIEALNNLVTTQLEARKADEAAARTAKKNEDERKQRIEDLTRRLNDLFKEQQIIANTPAGEIVSVADAERAERLKQELRDVRKSIIEAGGSDVLRGAEDAQAVALAGIKARVQQEKAAEAEKQRAAEETQRKREAESKKMAAQQKREQEKIDRDREKREKKLADLRKQVEKQTAAEREQNEKNLANIRRDIGRSIGRDLIAGTGPTFTGGSLTQTTGGGRASVTIENADIKRSAKYLDEIQRHTDAMTKLQEEANEKLNDIGRLG